MGQSYGKHGERTAAKRSGDGHKQLQQVLAEQADFHPNSAVAVIVMDAQIQGREAVFSIGADNVEEIGLFASQFLATPDDPLVAKSKLVTVAEAMLIRSFPESLNIEYKQFPRKDAPALVKELRAAGISHLGVEIDVSQNMALISHPDRGGPPSKRIRFAVNLETGERETLSTSTPLAWQAE
ncbi:MAG: hypothetical protein LH475_10485 [Cryobacterium sp.]|uniref:hypothetical protein n=1 Tax=unclassified Cryobacterium TaxID=2649013 RepID=UPI0018CB2FBA|nr:MULTISPECIES: hypothetical protein [unclassified Cryobacterium]MCY7405033.1 hypothetical protein [Cryobacterium sp.]